MKKYNLIWGTEKMELSIYGELHTDSLEEIVSGIKNAFFELKEAEVCFDFQLYAVLNGERLVSLAGWFDVAQEDAKRLMEAGETDAANALLLAIEDLEKDERNQGWFGSFNPNCS